MLKSLWSGVSGLRMHQIGMDVEGNNIANVSTYGFKYSRVNYSTMFSQTMAIATRPDGDLGGQNAMQVGLGVNANSTMRVHSQGSISKTDRNYDVAIEGNGFFMVSDDGGNNKYLTRDGAFNVDAAGNFVNTSGYVVQGWNRDPITGRIDTSLPVENLHWDPAMQIPANPSSEIYLNASLNSGDKITADTSRPIYALDSVSGYNLKGVRVQDEDDAGNTQFYTTSRNTTDITEKGIDFASVFNGKTNEALNLRDGQGIWVSYKNAEFITSPDYTNVFDPNNQATQNNVIFWGNTTNATILDITLNGVNIRNDNIRSIDDAVTYINSFTSPTDTRDGTGVTVRKKQDGSGLIFTNTNANGTTDNMKNINLVVNTANTAGEGHNMTYAAATQTFTPASQRPAGGAASLWTNIGVNNNNPVTTRNSVEVITAHKYIYSSSSVELTPMYNPDGVDEPYAYISGTAPQNPPGGAPTWGNTPDEIASRNYYDAVMNGSLRNTNARTFNSTEDLRELLQRDARYGVDYSGDGVWQETDVNEKVKVVVTENGQYAVSNANETSQLANGTQLVTGTANTTVLQPKNMDFNVSNYQDDAGRISTNSAMSDVFKGWTGNLNVGTANKLTTELSLSNFGASLQIYDSLGTKHLIQVQWTKHSTTIDGGNEWQMLIKVDEPAVINATDQGGYTNMIVGSIRFGNDGSLISYSPRTINFSGNNGSAPNQLINLNLGGANGFNGLVSNEQTSALSKQQTDGYAPGNLRQGMENTRIDQNGNILGSFDNGITLVLGRIAMGNVTNDSGLEDIGGNLYRVSANSGDLTIGTSGTGGRGSMMTSSIEASNADLSLSLTNLIVIQRAYQANSKTITTSDQLLNTLIQLKQ